jgi:hypothetical protein
MGASFLKVQSIRVSAQPESRPSAVLQGMELFLEQPMTDVQFSSVKEGPSCSGLGTVVGLSASANDLVDNHRDISRRVRCRDACFLVFSRESRF